MKKYITATIGSALVVPGLGQVLNGQIKKGLILMGVVFVIFIAGVIKLAQIITGILPGLNPDEINSAAILEKINVMDVSILRVIMIIFLVIWIYSIIDAFIYGLRAEKERNQS